MVTILLTMTVNEWMTSLTNLVLADHKKKKLADQGGPETCSVGKRLASASKQNRSTDTAWQAACEQQ